MSGAGRLRWPSRAIGGSSPSIGILGERPPTDLDGFVEYARTLWTRDVHAVIADAEAIGEASTGAFPANVRRRYDRLRRFPGRYVVTGDAVCSLEPRLRPGNERRVR